MVEFVPKAQTKSTAVWLARAALRQPRFCRRGGVTPPYGAGIYMCAPSAHLFYYLLFLISYLSKGFLPGFSALNIHNFTVGTRKGGGVAGGYEGLMLPHAGQQIGLALVVQLA